MRVQILAAMLVLLAGSAANASGFLLMNQGARSAARANAFAATADDGSAIYHNPAGITQLEGLQLYFGGNVIVPRTEYEATDGTTVKSRPLTALSPHFYATYKLNQIFSVGLGVNPPYGLSIKWGAGSPGRDVIREQVLRTWLITPVFGLDFSSWGLEGLSLAAGLDLAPASAYLRRDILFGNEAGQVELSGTDFGIGGRVGLLYKAPWAKGLSLGLAYRQSITFAFEGKANFNIDDPTLRALLPQDGDGSVDLTVPMVGTVGVGYQFTSELQAEVDVNYIGWSSYDELVIKLPDDSETLSERDWKDTFAVRVGLEYSPKPWSVRVGYAYDKTPVPNTTLDFTLPDANRNVVTAGFGIQLPYDAWVDLAGWYLIPASQETSDEPFTPRDKGKFTLNAWETSATLGIAIGKPPTHDCGCNHGEAAATDPHHVEPAVETAPPANDTAATE